ncbi:MAG: M23 family metallopeptidase [Pseudomonadales bacterium]
MEIRGWDDQGNGAFGSSRAKGTRRHKGVDVVVCEGDAIHAFRAGTVTKIWYPYDPKDKKKGHYRYVEIAVGKRRHRYFYVAPAVRKGDRVEAGQIIGHAQGLTKLYPGITDHIHFEIMLPDGSFIDPTNLVKSIEKPIAVISVEPDKDKAFYAKYVDGVIMVFRRWDGGKFSTMSKTVAEAIAFVEEQIKTLGKEFAVKHVDQIDWSGVVDGR